MPESFTFLLIRRAWSRPLLAAFSACAPIAVPANAQSVQPWPDLLVTAPVAGDWRVSGEVIGRIADDSRTSQLETRIEIGRALGKSVTVWAGWMHLASYNPHAPNGLENQAVEQVNWTIGALGPLRLSTRARLEERFIRGVGETSWRWRQQIRVAYALGHHGGPSAVLWTEPFVALNRTGAQSHTLDQLRTFIGISLPVSHRADLEIGYLNQRLYRPSTTIVNNVIPIFLTVRF